MIPKAQDQVVTLLVLLVEERAGLHHAVRYRDLFLQKIEQHVVEQGFPALLDFYWALRYDDDDGRRTAALVEDLVVGETYFFRELAALEQVVAHVVARAEAGLRSRVWSAACATGEEPLSLAVLLDQAGVLDMVEVVASDISGRHLTRAAAGNHTRRSLRAIPGGRPPWIREQDGVAVVDERLRAAVDWRQLNLVDSAAVASLGLFDAILCRNVLIYFDDDTVRRVVESLTAALAPDGMLVVGTSESLLRLGTHLDCVERGGAFFYRRTP
jgi:chemotaxis protein methyltransferase CheR